MKQRIFSTPPVSTERENRQRSRWLGLLLMFVFTSAFLVPSQQARAANAWEWPKFWATDLDVTSDDPAIAFEASYLNYDGNNFYWRTLDLVVDGVNIGFAKNGALFGAYMTEGHSFGEWAANHTTAIDWYDYPTGNQVF